MINKFSAILEDLGQSSLLGMVRFALARPDRAWNYVVRIGSRRWVDVFFLSRSEHQRYLDEIEASDLLESLGRKLTQKFETISGHTPRGNPYVPGTMKRRQALAIYSLIRRCSPQVLVETGVCNGFSTAVMLAAIEKNGSGHLYSIDYPEFANDEPAADKGFWEGKGGAVIPPDEESGWLIPENLRGRWTLILGKSGDRLPPLLRDRGPIDFFLHDSEHSFKNQLFEFRCAFQHLSDSGLLLASDITWSNAFNVFWEEINRQATRYFIDHNLVIVRRK